MTAPRWLAVAPAWYLWLVLAVTAVGGPALAIKISGDNQRRSEAALAAQQQEADRRQRQSERAWCGLFTVLEEGYTAPAPGSPPLTVRGQRIAKGIAEVRGTYRCT